MRAVRAIAEGMIVIGVAAEGTMQLSALPEFNGLRFIVAMIPSMKILNKRPR